MIGLTRLYCEKVSKKNKEESQVFDVPKSEVKNLKLRLEAHGWTVVEIEI